MRVRPMAVVVMRGFVMRSRLVMQAQEVHTEVVAVGRVNDGMGVEFLRFRIVQHHPILMVKLNQHHRALNPIIEGALVIQAAGPAEVRFCKMPFHVVHAGRERSGWQCR